MNKLRIAVVYKDEDIFVEFPQDVFVDMFKKYMGISERSKTWRKIDKSFEKIVLDLKKETRYA